MREAVSCNILLIDDEPALLRLVCTYLARFGYTVEACQTGAEGWRKYASAPDDYQVVITDLGLPDFDTEAVLPQFVELNPEIRVIVCSGCVFEPASLPRHVRENFSFLQKPFIPKMLSEAVAEQLNRATTRCAVA